MIKAIATAAFTHGPLNLRRGDEAEFTPPTFTALAAHGLVREKTDEPESPPARASRAARTPTNKKAPELQNKAAADAGPDAAAAPAAPDPAAEADLTALLDQTATTSTDAAAAVDTPATGPTNADLA